MDNWLKDDRRTGQKRLKFIITILSDIIVGLFVVNCGKKQVAQNLPF